MGEFQNKVKDIQERVKTQGIVINRVPKKIRKKFIELANEEFSEDYGVTLHWCIEQALEYQSMKVAFFENINYKLDNILEIVSQNEQKEKDEVIKTLSGKELKGGKKKNE